MRLRTLLFLAFALVALTPLAVAVPLASRRMEETFGRELAARADAAALLAQSELDRLGADVVAAVEACAADPATEALATFLTEGSAPAANAMRSVAEGRPFSVLTLRDAAGITRSSAFLPARVGDAEPGLAKVPSSGPAVVVAVEVQRPEGVELRPALVAARPVEAGEEQVSVVGGRLLDDEVVARLAHLTGARIELVGPTVNPAHAGVAQGQVATRTLSLGAAELRISLGSAAFDETRAAFRRALLTAGGLGLLLALGAGLWLARAITRPVEALTAGARAVASGDLETRVPRGGRGEVGVLVDAFNRMTEDLGKTTRALVAAERTAAWEGVARSLAHELRNPLTPLQMSLETLLAARQAGDARFDALFAESAPAMLEEVERLRRTIDTFARFARLPAGSREPLDLTAWAAQALAVHAGHPRMAIRWEPGPALPIEGDRDQLAQLLHNLLKNADEAMPQGGPVRVRTRGDGAVALLEVEDGGPGIPPDERARVFDPGFTRKPEGWGLGLALAARIAAAHGGILEVEGSALGGALFRLRLPLSTSAAPAQPG
jgi:two-component system, NtrC family, nitrogen regulation sensor histidine kinase NtrY